HHDLHTVRTPANIAVGNVFDAPANPLRRNRGILCCSPGLREIRPRSQAEQCLHVFTSSDGCHIRKAIYSPAHVLASTPSQKGCVNGFAQFVWVCWRHCTHSRRKQTAPQSTSS